MAKQRTCMSGRHPLLVARPDQTAFSPQHSYCKAADILAVVDEWSWANEPDTELHQGRLA